MIRVLRWISGVIVGLGFFYLGCLLWPEAFFSHHVRYGQINVYTTAPTALAATVADVDTRLSRSSLYDTSFAERVFICGSLRQFAFFTRGRAYLGGLCDDRLTRNIFIHPADFAAGRLQPYYGWRDDRPLSYFLAHEITHSLCSHYLGRWSKRVPTWLWEGYADYIGLSSDTAAFPPDARYVGFLLRSRDIRSLLSSPPAYDSVVAAYANSAR